MSHAVVHIPKQYPWVNHNPDIKMFQSKCFSAVYKVAACLQLLPKC